MSITTTLSGTLSLTAALRSTLSGDLSGYEAAALSEALTFAAAGGDAPTISGFFQGTAVGAAGDWLLAHASDPLQGMGNARYNSEFTVAGTKLKLLFVKNNDSSNSVTISRGTNGLPIFDASGDSITLAPGDFFLFYKKAGTGVLTTGSNDKLTIAVSGGTPNLAVLAAYGP